MPPKKWPITNTTSSKYVTDEMLTPFLPLGHLPTSQIELTLSCRNLHNTDILGGKLDPYCKVSLNIGSDKFTEVARTEVIKDTLNPEWVEKVVLVYNFEAIQRIRFEVLDHDADGGGDSDDLLGFFETTISELVAFAGNQSIGRLQGASKLYGEIVIVTQEVQSCKQIVDIQFRAENLRNDKWFGNLNPFLVLSRSNDDRSFSVVAKTEPLSPSSSSAQISVWKSITVRATTLCNGDDNRKIKVDCYDHRSNGSHKLIGTCYTTLSRLNASTDNASTTMSLINEEKEKSDPGHDSTTGELKVERIAITEELTFLDYLRNGTQIHFSVAIDFTASNGAPNKPKSLHYLSTIPNELNQYEIALRGVGEIMEHYDRSKLFPAFGFGAKLPTTEQVSHLFPLNGDPLNPYCSGVDGILHHYRHQLNSIQMRGPTNVVPVVKHTISVAEQYRDSSGHYFVLLIITNGDISDMYHTKRAIISASSLPMSIIFVGVGNAAFHEMHELDSDDVRLESEGHFSEDRIAERDIVQFVPIEKHLASSGLISYIESQAEFAKEVLAEIPGQLTSYMKLRGFTLNSTEFKPSAPPDEN